MSDNFYIFLDSRYKSAGSNSNFSVNYQNSNLEPGMEVAVSLESCQFYNLEYPINQYNNVIQFREALNDGVTYTATLTNGNYSGSELALEIQDKLRTASGNGYLYTVSYNDNTGIFTIAGLILPDVFKIVLINEIYGIDTMSGFSITTSGSRPAILAGVRFVDILFPSLISANMTNNPNNLGIMKRIPLDYPWGSLITYEQQESDQSVLIQKEYLNNIRVQVRRPDGFYYLLPDNSYISIVLKCTYRF
jgi:hypothetical protein